VVGTVDRRGGVVGTGLLFEHPSFHEHDPSEFLTEHPDKPSRLVAIELALASYGGLDGLGWERRLAPAATRAELEGVHDPALIDMVHGLCAAGGGCIDEDTYVNASSIRAALHASGAACAMVRALMAGDAGVGFAAVRPAGHHAERSRAMGFCLFNNVAVAAQLAIAELGVRRVLILDWDVHHGNGTAEIFRRRDDVLFASIHQAGIFPGGGALADAGSGPGFGYTINLPVHAGADGAVWLSLLEHVVLPAASVFRPQLVLISAGFDAHRDDPLADCRVDSDDFARMACHVRDFGRRVGAPVGAVLEGGYHVPSLAAGVISMMRALVGGGEAKSVAPEFAYTPRAASYVGQHWDLC
jgi:acetoin utilization deacetylase AcuC-like enzyme